MKDFADFWQEYEEALAQKNLQDFSDVINKVTLSCKKNPDLLLDLQERFQTVLVDEYQDTNQSQNEILWALTDYENPNIFAVGDDDQSIYRFQGASTANIKKFREKF